jgi:hypothetical protein
MAVVSLLTVGALTLGKRHIPLLYWLLTNLPLPILVPEHQVAQPAVIVSKRIVGTVHRSTALLAGQAGPDYSFEYIEHILILQPLYQLAIEAEILPPHTLGSELIPQVGDSSQGLE